MRITSAASIMAVLFLSGPALASPVSMDSLQGARRVLLVSAPTVEDQHLRAQQSVIAQWRHAAEERDVTVVQIVGDTVKGASDAAGALRARYNLPAGSFAAALVGKDGHVALRSTQPLSGGELGGTIDAMPMRRAGQR